MVVEHVVIYRIERLIVVISRHGIARGFVALHKIVVQRHQHRNHSQNAQLNAQPLGRGGFAARRRARHQHHPRALQQVGLEDSVGNGGQLLFVETFGYLDKVARLPLGGPLIELPDVGDPDDAHPLVVLGEGVEHFVLRHHLVEHVGPCALRDGDVHSFVIRSQVVKPDISRRWGQRTIEIAHRVAQSVERDIEPWARLQQSYLVVVSQFLVTLPRLVVQHFILSDGQVRRNYGVHLFFDVGDHFVGNLVEPRNFGIIAPRHAVPYLESLLGPQSVYGQVEGEEECPLVHPVPFEVGDVDKPDARRLEQHEREVLYLVVDVRCQYGTLGMDGLGYVGQRGPHLDEEGLAGVLTYYPNLFHCTRSNRAKIIKKVVSLRPIV